MKISRASIMYPRMVAKHTTAQAKISQPQATNCMNGTRMFK